MLLAAGRGERMRPLSDEMPKPLLSVAGRPLIVRQLERLRQAGVVEVVINHAHLGGLIEAALGSGSAWGMQIRYSPEGEALGTAGGVARALPLLGPEPFLLVSADLYCDYDYRKLLAAAPAMRAQGRGRLAHLVMVDNPQHHPRGDFALRDGQLFLTGGARLNYGNIGLYQPALFAGLPANRQAELGPLLRSAILAGRVSGEKFFGRWVNVGTPEQLAGLNAELAPDAC